MSAVSVVQALRHAFTSRFDRRAALARLAALQAEHAQQAERRAAELDAAEAEERAWREPERRLAAARAATIAPPGMHDIAGLETELQQHPPVAVRKLADFIDDVQHRIFAQAIPGRRYPALGEAMVQARRFVRDVGWKLDEADAARECARLRQAIEDAIEGDDDGDGNVA
jgi:hypothetical protein